MPTLTIPNSFATDGTILASEHNANFNAVATFVNSTKLDADNLQDNAVTTAKITDLSVTEAKLAAAVVAKLVPAGSIVAFGGTSAPTGWLLCDGTAVSRSTYSTLFTAVGESFGQGDNSTTFNVPDLRGRFLRGVDGSAGVDPDKATRTAMATGGNDGNNVGSIQGWATKAPVNAFTVSNPGDHTHNEQFHAAGGGAGTGIAGDAAVQTPFPATSLPTQGGGSHTHTVTGGDAETRPVNANVHFIIKT